MTPRSEPETVLLCPHLSDPPRGLFRIRWKQQRGTSVTVGSSAAPITVHLCTGCCERLGAADGDRRALELAAMTLVQHHILERFSRFLDGLTELLPLVSSPAETGAAAEPAPEVSREPYSKS